MGRKRSRARPPAPDRDKPPDATGLTIDWLGIQATAGGGCGDAAWVIGGLVALRAAPFLLWKVSRWLVRARRRDRSPQPRNPS